ncbi:rolling circle replication-associated protein [Paraburkholderia sp.]|uniref:rolling circle replication-associated protein n=1 Tax=Paraburkholderia sp. TaxID=1926495 RepID=UPI003D6F9B88
MGAQRLSLLPRAKRGKSENSEDNLLNAAKRAKQQVRQRCKAIQADHLVTLTFRGAMMDTERLKACLDQFRRRVARIEGFEYVAVPERHKSGGWHLHIAVHGRVRVELMRRIWWSIVGRAMGNIHARSPYREKGPRHMLAGYLSKYIVKGFESHKLNEKRYWTSRGILVPAAESIDHILSDDPMRVIKRVFAAAKWAGATLNRCQVYWQQELGCFWLSTR